MTLTALDFDVTQLSVHREVLQVHGTRRGDRQAVHNTETSYIDIIKIIIILNRYYTHARCDNYYNIILNGNIPGMVMSQFLPFNFFFNTVFQVLFVKLLKLPS